ncbi:hypothetical protein EW146_g1933 [Bondarzewia mesenterica]|uniref:Uncharacterized protein n=1 Tax=Bondarzewia mesenterica TaxID=1095465 RepID=A0A4S4M284_9AGAM|nr:hypothetical protein EW146_g1933 [Bondarzewia mesenterica]
MLLEFEDLRIDILSAACQLPREFHIRHTFWLRLRLRLRDDVSLSFGPSTCFPFFAGFLSEDSPAGLSTDGPFFVPRLHPSLAGYPSKLGRLTSHSGITASLVSPSTEHLVEVSALSLMRVADLIVGR